MRCSTDARPRALRVEAGRKGGQIRAAQHIGMKQDALVKKLSTMTPLECFLMGRDYTRRRLDNRMQIAKREGFSEGYEAALKDSK